MQPGIIPAIISFFLPGLGQAITRGRSSAKWIIVFIVVLIIDYCLYLFVNAPLAGPVTWGAIISIIIGIIFAYDAYTDIIQL